ncbi:hypothetical protein EDD18DRAFT_1356289 [Armillaria luteobubalina]|uniref:Uncharacterized protein n=1 Tax=Armillaria luteobubalina TaxID=153913 RepID=A0AA39Q0B8_9AGAR|nr:hypothetical protein EDD18DRAFT_1356289 [Armillaria luteobubalina]
MSWGQLEELKVDVCRVHGMLVTANLGIYNECDMFESSQASVKQMEMKDFDGKETDNEGSFNEEEQSQSGDQDEENSEDASGLEYKP